MRFSSDLLWRILTAALLCRNLLLFEGSCVSGGPRTSSEVCRPGLQTHCFPSFYPPTEPDGGVFALLLYWVRAAFSEDNFRPALKWVNKQGFFTMSRNGSKSQGRSNLGDPAEWPKIRLLNRDFGFILSVCPRKNSKTQSSLNFLQSGPRKVGKSDFSGLAPIRRVLKEWVFTSVHPLLHPKTRFLPILGHILAH